jgi:hypothetical protein
VNVLHTIKGENAISIGYILNRNCLIEHIIEEERMRRRGIRRKQLVDDLEEKRILGTETESTGSHSVENYLLKKLFTCRKTDYVNRLDSVFMLLFHRTC